MWAPPKVGDSIRIAAALDGVRRMTFASFGVAGGLSLPLIAAILGHRDVKTPSSTPTLPTAR